MLTALLLVASGSVTSAPVPTSASAKAVHREVERDEALLRRWLKGLPAGSGVIMVREEGELLLRFPASLIFDPESTAVSGDAAQSLPLTALERLLKRRKKLSAQIVVYADNIGGANLNQSLTDQRAHALGDLLQAQGIDTRRLSTRGAGISEPIGSNDTPEGRIQNRRVEVQLRRE